MKTINYITKSDVVKHNKFYYTQRAHFVNKLSKQLHINYYANIKISKDIDLKKYQKIKEDVKLKNITFKKNILSKQNIRKIKKIQQQNKKELFFTHYPMHFYGLLAGYILRNNKTVFWCKADPKDQFVANGNTFTKPIRFLMKPLFSLVYDTITKFIFKDNLVFYTSSITTDKKNHLNQYELTSCSEFNRDKKLIKNEFTNKIFFVGGEENQKGLTLLLKALQGSNKELNIIGMEKIRRKKNKKLARNVNIQFHGKIYQRKSFYDKLSQADIVVMPSYGEKQGKVQLEAMSVGAVPICSDSGGTHRTIDNYYNGLLFKEGSWKQLREQIQLLYKDKELYKRLKQNGLEYISELSVEKQVKKMAEIINNYYKVNE